MQAPVRPASRRMLLAGVGLALVLPRRLLAQGPAQPEDAEAIWPHTLNGPGGSATIYQPQVISWPRQTTLNARAAVAVTRKGDKRQILGKGEVTAQTSTDFATRSVTLSDIRLVSSRFSVLDTGEAARLDARLRAAMPASPSSACRWTPSC